MSFRLKKCLETASAPRLNQIQHQPRPYALSLSEQTKPSQCPSPHALFPNCNRPKAPGSTVLLGEMYLELIYHVTSSLACWLFPSPWWWHPPWTWAENFIQINISNSAVPTTVLVQDQLCFPFILSTPSCHIVPKMSHPPPCPSSHLSGCNSSY